MDHFLGKFTSTDYDNCNYNNFNNYSNNNNNGVHFAVDDLLDYPKEDETMTDAFFDCSAGNSGDSSTVTAVESSNSSVSGGGGWQFKESQFPGNEFCVPQYDDLAELEWLSNFVEESFSTTDHHHHHHLIPAPSSSTTSSTANTTPSPPIFPSDAPVPGKARSKRSRAAPGDWSSRLLLLSQPPPPPPQTETPARRCLHCASEKTPQWRTGPMGPKTLCNACGVRYKSGRLVPEYRPAASPTFVPVKHSNSHRKVLELRKKNEYYHHQQLVNQASIYDVSIGCDEQFLHHNRVEGGAYSLSRHMSTNF